MESLMNEHCNVFAARSAAAVSPFGFGPPFGLPPGMPGMPGNIPGVSFDAGLAAAAAAAATDPTMAALFRERVMLFGLAGGAPGGGGGAQPGSPFAPGRMPPGMGQFGVAPQMTSPTGGTAAGQFWPPTGPAGGIKSDVMEMYHMQQQQWYQAMAAANGGRLPPGVLPPGGPPPPPPTGATAPNGQNPLQFAQVIAASNPQLWAAMAAAAAAGYGNPNGSAMAPMAGMPMNPKMLSPTFLKQMQLGDSTDARLKCAQSPESPRKPDPITDQSSAPVVTES